MKKKEKDLTKRALLFELGKKIDQMCEKFEKSISSLKLGKRLEKIDTRIELALGRMDDVVEFIKHQDSRIKELEKRVEELSEPRRS